jgi:voltage-gated potassium channel
MQRRLIYKTLWQDFFVYFLLFVLLVLFGTFGYMILQDYTFLEALFMTVITLSTVGYAETKPLDDTGRIFSIILIIINIGILTYIVTKTSRFLFDGELVYLFKRATMENKIDRLKNHVIVCGYGRIGSKAYTDLISKGLEVVVVEKEHIEGIPFLIQADASTEEALITAGVKRAKFILCALPNDAENVFIILTAKELNPAIKAISRAAQEASVRKLRFAGAENVIMPDNLGGIHMANLVLFPDLKEFIDIMSTSADADQQIVEMLPAQSQTLESLKAWTTTGASILGIRRENGEYIVNPSPDYLILPKDKLFAVGTRQQIEALKKII